MEYEPYYPPSYTSDQSVLFSMSPKVLYRVFCPTQPALMSLSLTHFNSVAVKTHSRYLSSFVSVSSTHHRVSQQYPQHELEEIWPETISPSVLSGLPSYGVQIYNDEESFSNHVPISIPPINVNIALATSNAHHPGPSSSVSTTPNTPGLVSPSHAGYASSPSLLNVSPPTPSYNLRPDAYHPFPTSAPVSPYPSQRSPWHLSNAVRILSFLLPTLV